MNTWACIPLHLHVHTTYSYTYNTIHTPPTTTTTPPKWKDELCWPFIFSHTALFPHPIYQQPWEKCVSSDFWKPCTPCDPSFYSEVRCSFFLPGPFYVCSPYFLPRGLTKSVSSLQPEWYFNMVNLIMPLRSLQFSWAPPRAPEWKPNFLAWQTAPSWASPRPLCGPVL